MRVNGRMICSMERVLRLGLMGQGMRETMPSGENMASALINGMMDLNTQVIGRKTRLVGLGFIHG